MDDQPLRTHTSSAASGEATVSVDPTVRGEVDVDPFLSGKFVEHLYSPRNVQNSLEAQTLFNPTFGSWKFQVPSPGPDGGRPAEHDPETVTERIERYVDWQDLPDADRLAEAYRSGTALWWFPCGDAGAESGTGAGAVTTSPDVGTAGDRAQRVEVAADAEGGVAQWCYLPTHRTRSFEGKATLKRSAATGAESADGATGGPGADSVTVAVHEVGADGTLGDALADATVPVTEEYRTVEFDLSLPDSVDGERGTVFAASVTAAGPANVVVDRVLLYPDDHVGTVDPEVIELLREADLPVLRWPGGNFVSGYHWEDGIGPIEERPTKPNPAWDGLETNRFGTDEFATLCEAVGCEPMICLNAGNGTAEEAARWVEYCNGDPEETELGALRAEHGHPEPYDVTYWEVGNEVYGEWQTTWTTPGGYADRFRRFHDAMTAVDDSIEVFACGNRFTDWNDPVVADAGDEMDWITDHALVGGAVDPATEPAELYNAYTGFAEQLGEEYREFEARLRENGFENPRLAVTELQLFATVEGESPGDADDEGADDGDAGDGNGDGDDGDRGDIDADDGDDPGASGEPLTWETVPTSKSVSEAVYDSTVIHQCIRQGEFVGMVTHSGTGNHGGWLQKRKGRVWADPCYYNHRLASSLFGGTPVRVDLTCGTFSTETTFGDDMGDLFGQLDPVDDAPVLDALAVVHGEGEAAGDDEGADGGTDEDADHGEVTVVLVHRDARTDAVDVDVEFDAVGPVGSEATARVLTADSMSARNTFEEPRAVTPDERTLPVEDGTVSLSLSPFSVAYVTVERK